MEKVIERPALPLELTSLVQQLQTVFQQYGYRINRLLPADGSEYTPEFIAPTLLNSWADLGSGYRGAGYYKDALGRVQLSGTVLGGASGSVVFTLPEGFRPSENLILGAIYFGSGTYGVGELNVSNAGAVAFYYSGPLVWFSLDGISFVAV